MSRKGRRKEPDRTRRRTMPTIKDGQVRVAIATSPSPDVSGIARDVELAKAALLYADEVEMVGLGVALLEELRQQTSGELGMFGLLRALDAEALEYVQGPSARRMPANWREVLEQFAAISRATVPPHMESTITELNDQLAELNEGARPLIDDILGGAGATELAVAVDAGVVRVAPLNVDLSSLFRGRQRRSDETQVQIETWVDALLDRLKDRKLRMLFDEDSAGIVDAMHREGRLPDNPQAVRLAGQAALGAGLVAKLPAFPQARMDGLLDLRKDLARPIKGYQGAIVRHSRNLPQALGEDLTFEIDQLWQSDVAPAIDELRDELAHHSFVRELGRHVDTKGLGKFGWTPAVALGVGIVGDPSTIETALLGGVAAVPPMASVLLETLKARSDLGFDVRRRDFYMLYEANRRLSP